MSDLYQVQLQNQWSLYEKGEHDSVVKIGDKEFKVFKAFFMAQSPVFERMFKSSFKEGITGTVEIQDIDEATMMKLIRWLYTFQIEDENQIEDLFVAADKYDIAPLKKDCVNIMISSFDSNNVRSRVILAAMHNDEKLKTGALEFVKNMSTKDFSNCFMSHDWIKFTVENEAVATEIADLIHGKMNEKLATVPSVWRHGKMNEKPATVPSVWRYGKMNEKPATVPQNWFSRNENVVPRLGGYVPPGRRR